MKINVREINHVEVHVHVCSKGGTFVLNYMYTHRRLKGHGQGGVDKNEVRAIAGPVMDMLTKK